MKMLRLLGTTVAAGLVGCSVRMGSARSAATPAAYDDVSATTPLPPPIVQVRDYWGSSVVSIVAWDADDPSFGLRTSVTRTGELVGGTRFGDHRLFVSRLVARAMGGFKYASVTEGKLLLRTGTQRDDYACFYGKTCSPMVAEGVRLPDSVLRASRDSLTVTFFPGMLEPWSHTLRGELVAAYLEKVDSVVAAMKKAGST
jgi:hypothetical protein